MPIYKGTTEIASGKLYKAATNIENGYKGTNQFYVNEITVTLTAPTGWVLSQNSITGVPGTGSGTFTLTRSTPGALVQQRGTATVSGGSLSFGSTSTSGSNSGINNTVTITTQFTIPTSNQSVTLAIAGMTDHTYAAHFRSAQITPDSTTTLTNPGTVSNINTGSTDFSITRIAGSLAANGSYYVNSSTDTTNVFYTGFSPGTLNPAYAPNYISWSTTLSVSGSSTSATVGYPNAQINMVSSTVASGATAGNRLTVDPSANIYLDGDNTCRTTLYA